MKLRTILSEILNEASFDQLKTQFVDTDKVTQETFDKITNSLNNINNKSVYATWLISKIAKNIIKLEDLDKWIGTVKEGKKVDGYLETYEKYKNKVKIKVKIDNEEVDIPIKDINTVKEKNIPAFIKSIVDIQDNITKDPSKAAGSNKLEKYKEFYIGNVDGFSVFELPKGRTDLYGISCDLGSGTQWCTATGKTREYFDEYINDGPLFIFIKKGSDEKYQFSYESGQFMDKYDNSLLQMED